MRWDDILLAVLVLGVGLFLARRARPLVAAILFVSAITVSAMLFLPGSQLTAILGSDGVRLLNRFAAATPWSVAEWMHVFIFLWLGLLLWLGRADLRGWKAWILVVVLAVASELAQGLTLGREPRLEDVLLNLAGGMAGIVLAIGLRKLIKRL